MNQALTNYLANLQAANDKYRQSGATDAFGDGLMRSVQNMMEHVAKQAAIASAANIRSVPSSAQVIPLRKTAE